MVSSPSFPYGTYIHFGVYPFYHIKKIGMVCQAYHRFAPVEMAMKRHPFDRWMRRHLTRACKSRLETWAMAPRSGMPKPPVDLTVLEDWAHRWLKVCNPNSCGCCGQPRIPCWLLDLRMCGCWIVGNLLHCWSWPCVFEFLSFQK